MAAMRDQVLRRLRSRMSEMELDIAILSGRAVVGEYGLVELVTGQTPGHRWTCALVGQGGPARAVGDRSRFAADLDPIGRVVLEPRWDRGEDEFSVVLRAVGQSAQPLRIGVVDLQQSLSQDQLQALQAVRPGTSVENIARDDLLDMRPDEEMMQRAALTVTEIIAAVVDALGRPGVQVVDSKEAGSAAAARLGARVAWIDILDEHGSAIPSAHRVDSGVGIFVEALGPHGGWVEAGGFVRADTTGDDCESIFGKCHSTYSSLADALRPGLTGDAIRAIARAECDARGLTIKGPIWHRLGADDYSRLPDPGPLREGDVVACHLTVSDSSGRRAAIGNTFRLDDTGCSQQLVTCEKVLGLEPGIAAGRR